MYDSQTGLYYLNARYYNPVTGRFLSEDPVGPNASNPLSYNEYAYAENNPVNRVDPSGEFSWRWIGNFPRYIAPPSWVYSDFFAANPEFSALEEAEAELAVRLEGTQEVEWTTNSEGLPEGGEITGYTEHGAEQMLGRDGGRGVSNEAIQDTVSNPQKVVEQPPKGPGYGPTFKYVGKNAVVVLNEEGQVVTGYAKGSQWLRGGK